MTGKLNAGSIGGYHNIHVDIDDSRKSDWSWFMKFDAVNSWNFSKLVFLTIIKCFLIRPIIFYQ